MTYLAQSKFIERNQEKIFYGQLAPEVITFKDCHAGPNVDFTISLPNCKVLNLISSQKQRIKAMPGFTAQELRVERDMLFIRRMIER